MEFADLLFPRRCPVCGEIVIPRGGLICPECVKELSWVKPPVCLGCGKEIHGFQKEYCRDCQGRSRSYQRGAALLNYNQAAARSMAKIKYEGRREYLDFYAAAMAGRLGEKIRRMKAQALVPVPVHPSRLRVRGFNQALELSRRLSRLLGIPTDAGLLKRSRKTMPQKDLDPRQRLKNLEQAFHVSEERLEEGRIPESVILVDDIYTTGSTIEACARTLKRAGTKDIYYVSICIGGGR